MRRCMLGAVWGVANVSLCENVAIAEIGRVVCNCFIPGSESKPNENMFLCFRLKNCFLVLMYIQMMPW